MVATNKQFNINLLMHQLLLLVMGLLFTLMSHASGTESLRKFYDETHAMKADFHQIVLDAQGRKIQEVYGEMMINRPNQFRWDYRQPYEQQIVSNGKQVWLYDVELEQVTVTDVSQALGNSPAALLSGGEGIDENFVMRDFNKEDDLSWVSVVPKSNTTGYNQIELAFNAQHLLQEMKLVDSFGQHTNIVFSHQQQNPTLDTKMFFFQPPQGVDVVGE